MLETLKQDLQANRDGNTKSRLVLVLFRLVQACATLPWGLSVLRVPVQLIYQFTVEWVLGIEIPWNTSVGPGLRLLHGVALVVNCETVIGQNCILRHSTTIGNKILANGQPSGSPVIGDNVEVGSNTIILGAITIGNGAVIGAGSVVTKDVPPYAVMVGNPARILRQLDVSKVPDDVI